ncbi:MAG TPA: response regulator [Candidatus Binatia bacterium]|nr:response regulator [Candidatus Binatia bacterium]
MDDEPHVRSMLCDLLALWGSRPVGVASGREALSRFAEGGWDLVLTDLIMSGMSGIEVAEQVRSRDTSVELIMLTASTADLEAHARRLSFTVVRKPLPLAELEAAVRDALARRRARVARTA